MIDLSVCKCWTLKPPSGAKARFFDVVQKLDPNAQREVQFHWLFSPKLAERSEREARIAQALIQDCHDNRHLNPVKALADPDQILADERCKGRSRTLEFDFVLPGYGVAIEFDERQHFTAERRITLEFYEEGEFAFTRDWKGHCKPSISDPDRLNPARDWQRAFKDAIRDLRSRENGIPLVRLHHHEYVGDRLENSDVVDRLKRAMTEAKAILR